MHTSIFALGLLWLLSCTASATTSNSQQLLLGHDRYNPKSNQTDTLPALLDALDVLQTSYFEVWQGIWPSAIDWTSAVLGTYLSSSLITLSSHQLSSPGSTNLVNKYFSHLIGFYFGQDAFALRQEAYDDMLWVVLGWLETTKFVDSKGDRGSEGWYGEDYVPAFAHRARVFWDIARQGWDEELCDGGMIWNPYLVPYKNAITNELYITASISMYLNFPGDGITSPFGFGTNLEDGMRDEEGEGRSHHPKYLAAAIEGYKWLKESNMTDKNGLYVDGYHISGWSRDANQRRNTKCDARNEMVYTYNQGVLLSGQRGLYLTTGARSYLEDGHKLVADVIAATGWSLKDDWVMDDEPREKLGKWRGLGRSGLLEEYCDAPGFCSQDGQTFKGIFFHHLTLFCERLPDHLILPGELFLSKGHSASPWEVRKWHDDSCAKYKGWIRHNAKAALGTRDAKGKFGMWWGAPEDSTSMPDTEDDLPKEATDYRNTGVPKRWQDSGETNQRLMTTNGPDDHEGRVKVRDLNDRGRGRTVETQGGGVAVLRAAWELVDSR